MADDAMICCAAQRPRNWDTIRQGWVSLIGIVAMMLAVGTTVTVATVTSAACVMGWYGVARRHPRMAAWLAGRAQRKQLSDKRDHRVRALVRAGVREHDLADLTALVDETLRNDPDAGDRYDLEALLDRYTELEIARTQTKTILQRFDRGVLARQLDAMTRAGKRTRRDLLERRLAHIDACRDRLVAMDDDVDEIRELICLLAQRAATASFDESDDIERRVMMLDDGDITPLHACEPLRHTGS
jgi:hypothetical protein